MNTYSELIIFLAILLIIIIMGASIYIFTSWYNENEGKKAKEQEKASRKSTPQ